jgi:mercuric transport protein
MLGVSGAWIGNLAVLSPYKPIFVVVTLSLLGLAFYQVYRNPQTCDSTSACASPSKNRMAKTILWIATAFILGLLAFPYVVPLVFAADIAQQVVQTKRVVLQVSNMVCEACPVTVKKSLTRLNGVKTVNVTLRPPEAVVIYDPAKVSTQDLIQATKNVGYPSSVKPTSGTQ